MDHNVQSSQFVKIIDLKDLKKLKALDGMSKDGHDFKNR